MPPINGAHTHTHTHESSVSIFPKNKKISQIKKTINFPNCLGISGNAWCFCNCPGNCGNSSIA